MQQHIQKQQKVRVYSYKSIKSLFMSEATATVTPEIEMTREILT